MIPFPGLNIAPDPTEDSFNDPQNLFLPGGGPILSLFPNHRHRAMPHWHSLEQINSFIPGVQGETDQELTRPVEKPPMVDFVR